MNEEQQQYHERSWGKTLVYAIVGCSSFVLLLFLYALLCNYEVQLQYVRKFNIIVPSVVLCLIVMGIILFWCLVTYLPALWMDKRREKLQEQEGIDSMEYGTTDMNQQHGGKMAPSLPQGLLWLWLGVGFTILVVIVELILTLGGHFILGWYFVLDSIPVRFFLPSVSHFLFPNDWTDIQDRSMEYDNASSGMDWTTWEAFPVGLYTAFFVPGVCEETMKYLFALIARRWTKTHHPFAIIVLTVWATASFAGLEDIGYAASSPYIQDIVEILLVRFFTPLHFVTALFIGACVGLRYRFFFFLPVAIVFHGIFDFFLFMTPYVPPVVSYTILCIALVSPMIGLICVMIFIKVYMFDKPKHEQGSHYEKISDDVMLEEFLEDGIEDFEVE